MSETSTKIFIEASPAKCFAVFTDFQRMADRIDALVDVNVLTDGDTAIGTQWRETRKMFGQEATEVMTISSFDPPHSYAATASSHGSEYNSRFDFTPESEGTTVTMTFRATPVSLIAKAMSLFSGAMMKSVSKAVAADMADLKNSIENTN